MWGPGFGRRRAYRRGFWRGYWAGRMGPGPWRPMRPWGWGGWGGLGGWGCAPVGCALPILFLLAIGMMMLFAMPLRWF